MEYLQSFMENAEYISEKDFGFVAESVNLQCYAEDTFVARANDVLDFMGSNDIDSFDEALNYVAEAHGIQYQPIMAIKESDIDMAVMFAEMGDSSLLEAYDAIIEQCVEENIALVLETKQSEQPEQPAQSKPGLLAKTGTKLKGTRIAMPHSLRARRQATSCLTRFVCIVVSTSGARVSTGSTISVGVSPSIVRL